MIGPESHLDVIHVTILGEAEERVTAAKTQLIVALSLEIAWSAERQEAKS
jgi:hypothetical protein